MSEETVGANADDFDAACELLLAIARDPANIRRVTLALEAARQRAVQEYSRRRLEWDHKVMACGHERRHYVPAEGKSAAEFVADAQSNGVCVVCGAVDFARRVFAATVREPNVPTGDLHV